MEGITMVEEARHSVAVAPELAAKHVMAPYIREQHDRPSVDAEEAPIPVIDIGRLSGTDPDGDIAAEEAKFREALETWGIIMVTNHGVDASLMDAMMNVSREFFQQPNEDKQKYTSLKDGKRFQLEGYRSDELKSEGTALDWCSRLTFKIEPHEARRLDLWPEHPKSFRDVLHDYATRTKRVRDIVVRAMANLLDLNEDFVNKFTINAPALARIACYPPCPSPELVSGFRPHADGGSITVLFVDEHVGGLQVQREGKWYNVPIKPGTLLVNIGDVMQIMNNGIFRSPIHRVVTNAKKERISVAILYSVDGETVLEALPGLLDEKRPEKYMKVKAQDYYDTFFDHFRQGERYLNTLKI